MDPKVLLVLSILESHVKMGSRGYDDTHNGYKVGCVFPMAIWCEFRMGKHRADDHQEDAPHFSLSQVGFYCTLAIGIFFGSPFRTQSHIPVDK